MVISKLIIISYYQIAIIKQPRVRTVFNTQPVSVKHYNFISAQNVKTLLCYFGLQMKRVINEDPNTLKTVADNYQK